MRCLNKSLPIVKEALAVIKSEPALAKIIDRLGDNISMDNILNEWAILQKQADSSIDPQILEKLDNFVLFEDLDTLCGEGICNYTAKKSEEKLKEVGLNPYGTGHNGGKVYVTVKTPLANFDITHFISIVAIGRSLYVYDMPQNEFISDDFYGRGGKIKVKTAYKPRLIPFTVEDIAASYNINYTEAASFIKSVINNRGYVNDGEGSVEDYIKKNIIDGEYYLNELKAVVESAGIQDTYFNWKLRDKELSEKSQNADAKLFTKKLSESEQEKVGKLLETKLKMRTREYVPKTKTEFLLRDLIKNVIGKNSFFYDYTKGLSAALSSFKEYLNGDKFKEDLKNNLRSAEAELKSINNTLEAGYSKRNLMLNFIKLAKQEGWENALAKFDAAQRYKIRTSLPINTMTMYKSEKQRIYMTEKYFKDVNNVLEKRKNEKNKQTRHQDLLLDKFKATQRINKSSTIINFINAFEQDTSYLFDVIQNEAERQYAFFQRSGQEYFQLAGTETPISASEEVNAAVRKRMNEWFKRVGVEVSKVKEIVVGGQKFDANAVVNFSKNLIEYVEGKEDSIVEEGIHIGVEWVEQTNPKLFNKLLNRISSYPIYQQTLDVYRHNIHYQVDGKPDIRKIKKEAIAKKLVENLIVGTEDALSQKEEVATWWQQIKDWIRSLVIKAGFNPFESAVQQIMRTETIVQSDGFMFDLNTYPEQDRIFKRLKEVSKQVDKRDEKYYVGDRVIKRVSSIVDAVYKRMFGDREMDKSDYQKAVDDIKKGRGTAGHLDMEHLYDVYIDEETGFIRNSPQQTPYAPQTNADIYDVLEKYFVARLATFPKNTRFLKETLIYDGKDLGGTVDFMAITTEGIVSLLDWKFSDFNPEKSENDVPWYKKKAWRIQMRNYKKILTENYGIKASAFDKTEMIPIKANYKQVMAEDGKLYPKLLTVEIGNEDSILEAESYLWPVALEEQSSGDPKLDALLTKLVGFKETMETMKVNTAEDRFRKAEQLNAIEKAFRHIQMKRDIEPLLDNADLYTIQVQALFDYYDAVLADADFVQLRKEDPNALSEFGKKIDKVFDDITIFTNLDNDLSSLFKGELSEEQKEVRSRIKDVASKARGLQEEIIDLNNKFSQKVADTVGIEDVTQPEKVVTGASKVFNVTSKIQVATLQVLYQLSREAQNLMDFKTRDENHELQEIEGRYKKWASAKGLTLKNYFDILVKKDNRLIDKYNKDFYTELKKATDSKDLVWITQNIDLQAFQAKMQTKLAESVEYYTTKHYTGTPKEVDKKRNDDIAKAKADYDLSTPESKGWTHYKTMRGFPTTAWESVEWKTLTAAGNEPAYDLYKWIIKINEKADKVGYLPAMKNNSKRTFLPFTPKGVIEAWAFGGSSRMAEKFVESFTIDEDTVGYGEWDKVTGRIVNKIPRYFTNEETTKELSTDLFKNLAVYNGFVNQYQHLDEIEGIALSLGRVEENKQSIVTSYWGNPKFKDNTNEVDTIKDNRKNSELYQKQMQSIIYRQKYIQSDQFDVLLGNVGSTLRTINKTLGFELFPNDMDNRQLSMVKGADALNNFFQQKTIGLNPLAAMSTLFGGTVNAIINAGTYFTKTDFVASEFELTSLALNGEKGKKLMAAIRYFMPFTDDMNRELAKHLSLVKVSEETIQDFLFSLMRGADKAVQASIFISMLRNAVIIDGQIHNAREYLRNRPEYKARYINNTVQEMEEVFEKEVKDLITSNGLWTTAKVEKGKLVIPDIESNSKEVFKVRNYTRELSKKALGNMTPEEVRGAQQNILWRSAMMFKNWIPPLANVRFGELKYDSALEAYEWGRARTVFRYVLTNGIKSILDLKSAVVGGEAGLEGLRQLYEYKAKAYKADTGKDLVMSEADFNDLVRQNIANFGKDAVGMTLLISLLITAYAMAPDDDDDDEAKIRHKFTVRMLDKLTDELTFFYLPTSASQILNSSIFPSVSIFTDLINLLNHFGKEMYGMTFDENLQEKNHVIKYVLKTFPIASQLTNYMPLYAPDVAKELGIKVSTQSRR